METLVEGPQTALGASRATATAARKVEPRIAELCAVYARLVDVVAEAATTGAWQGAGIRSLGQWVSWKTGLSPGGARKLADIAAAAESHPKVTAVFRDGLLSIDQAALAVSCDPVDDAEFAHLARVMTTAQLRIALRASQPPEPAAAPGEPPAPPASKPERVEMFSGDDGSWNLICRLAADRGMTVEAALREARDRLFRDGHTDVTWADALVDIARRSLDAVDSVGRRERFRITVFIDPEHDARATWTNGITIPDAIRDLLLCDGTITPTFTTAGRPVNVGRSLRIVPDRLRRLVEHRDEKCRVPWCQRERGLDIHHLIHWRDGGPTDLWNLIALCERCHRAHHQGLLGITGNADRADGLIFTDQHGRIIDFAAHPQPPDRPAPTPRHRYRHPDGGRLQKSALLFNPNRRTTPSNRHRHHPNGTTPSGDSDSDDGPGH